MVDPNSSFRGDGQEKESNPIGRWRTVLSAEEVAQVESLIGAELQETEYALVTPTAQKHRSLPVSLMGLLYPIYFDVKLWLKTYTPLAKTAAIGRMGISDPPTTEPLP
jgi:hypothetical protein